MAANSSISLVNLDFDSIKTNLKTYLKAQPLFKDYDFDGSNMSVLLDILSYNTFHNAFYLNMIASESFLDSAQLRNSILSHAKELNYVPRSARSARASINLEFDSNEQYVVLPKGTSFSSTIGFELFNFTTTEEQVFFSSNGTYNITNLNVYEGTFITDTFVMDYENPVQRFVLTDPNIDTRSLTVTITEDDAAITRPYVQSSTLLGVGATDNVFFLQGAEGGKYEIVFGDNIIGRKPKDNAVIEVEYRVTRGSNGNGATLFELDTAFTDFTTAPVITTVDISSGGDGPESNESIKYYAPRFFQIQERAVNAFDYEIILKQRFPEINAISAYGGEELNPPQYGKVFISVDISDVEGLPDSKKLEYFNFLKPRSPLSIDPTIVEPDYLYYTVDSVIKFNVNVTSLTTEQIKSFALNQILTYNQTYLDDFKAQFRYSKFLRDIDDACQLSVISNETDITIYKKVRPTVGGSSQNIDINFDIPLTLDTPSMPRVYNETDLVTVFSDDFILNGERVKLHDDGNGNLRIVKLSNGVYTIVTNIAGSVNYDTGFVQLINFKIDALVQNKFNLYAIPRNKDFETTKNTILTLEPSEINITVVPVRNLPGNYSQSCQRV